MDNLLLRYSVPIVSQDSHRLMCMIRHPFLVMCQCTSFVELEVLCLGEALFALVSTLNSVNETGVRKNIVDRTSYVY